MISKLEEVRKAILTKPGYKVWKVTFTFADGSTRKVCISPGNIPEKEAARRARAHAKIFDDSVLAEVSIEMVVRDLGAIRQHGIMTK